MLSTMLNNPEPEAEGITNQDCNVGLQTASNLLLSAVDITHLKNNPQPLPQSSCYCGWTGQKEIFRTIFCMFT